MVKLMKIIIFFFERLYQTIRIFFKGKCVFNDQFFIMKSYSLWMLPILTIINSVSSKMLIVRMIQTAHQNHIAVYNKFKFNEIFLSNNTRRTITTNPNFEDINSIPNVQVEYRSIALQKYINIDSNTHAYVMRYALEKDQIYSFLKQTNTSQRNEIILINKESQDLFSSVRKNICFYQGNTQGTKELQIIIKKCINNEGNELTNDLAKNLEVSHNFLMLIVSSIICLGVTGAKLLYFTMITKPSSVI